MNARITASLPPVVIAIVVGAPMAAYAAPIAPKSPTAVGSFLPPDSRCTVEALNVGGVVFPDGRMLVPNVPRSSAQVRLRATCTELQGNTVNGQSGLAPMTGTQVSVSPVSFDSPLPVAARLQVTPSTMSLVGLAASQQLTVNAVFADSSSGNVSAASAGTTYRSSNPAVAIVSPDGVVTAVGAGTAILSAANEGAIGFASVTVRSAPVANLDITPASVNISVNPAFPNRPVPLRSLGLLTDGSTVDLTMATGGTTYSSSNPAVAMVSADGGILGLSGGTATITVSNGGVQTQVPVTVNAFAPGAIAAYNTPGYAHNVDVQGSLVYVADGTGGLQIYSRTSPTALGKLAFPGLEARDVRVRDTIAAVALENGGLAIVDVATPAQPAELWRVSPPGSVKDVWISGNRVYAASSAGLHVYDISNLAAAPTLVGSIGGMNAVAVSADSARGLAVVATGAGTLVVVQTGGPQPWATATAALGATPYDAVLIGTSALVATGTSGVKRVDVSRLEQPVLDASSSMIINALGVAAQRVNNGLLVAAADNIFVNAVPLFNAELANVFNVNFSNFPGTVRSDANGNAIALGDGFGVVAVGYDGIQIFRTRQLVDNAGVPPVVSISDPVGGDGFISGALATINATAQDDVGVALVELFVDDVSVGVDTEAPFTASFSPGTPCTTQTVRARATDDQGNFADSLEVSVRVLCAEGQSCSTDADCANNVCVSGVCQAPCNLIYASCGDLRDACPTVGSGMYAIDPDGAGPVPSFQTYCDMNRAGGGWTLVAKMSNQDAKNWVNSEAAWTSVSFFGNTQSLSEDQDAKSRAWGTVNANELLLTDNPDPASGEFLVTTSNCLEGLTPSDFFTDALASYPGAGGQTWYKQCQVANTYVPAWTYEPYWLDDYLESPNNALTHGYLLVGRSDEDDTYAVLSFYATGEMLLGPSYDPILDASGEYEADVGLAVSDRDGEPFSTLGDAQDVGGPTSCGLSDAVCRADYPQTVFVFVR